MRETIQNYFEKTKQYPNYYSNEDFSTICDGIKKEIDDYINLFWHPCIRGYCNTKESIVLFSVLKRKEILVMRYYSMKIV